MAMGVTAARLKAEIVLTALTVTRIRVVYPDSARRSVATTSSLPSEATPIYCLDSEMGIL
jgi:hypothetical protein